MSEKEIPVKCRKCRKSPKNCDCVEYELVSVSEGRWRVLASNIATEPVRGQEARTWQPRANARVWRSPTYVDGYIVLYLTDGLVAARVKEEIDSGEFNPFYYEGVYGARLPEFPKEIIRRFAFLRRARQRAEAESKAA